MLTHSLNLIISAYFIVLIYILTVLNNKNRSALTNNGSKKGGEKETENQPICSQPELNTNIYIYIYIYVAYFLKFAFSFTKVNDVKIRNR